MTERTSRWSAENLQRIYSDRYGGDDQSVARLAHDYIALLDENERLREALEFYADDANWGYETYDGSENWTYVMDRVEEDKGDVARAALNGADDDTD